MARADRHGRQLLASYYKSARRPVCRSSRARRCAAEDIAMLRSFLLLLAVTAMALPAAAHSHKTKSLEIVHPHTRQTAKDATSARVFMTVKSTDGRPDRRIAATTSRAGKVDLQDAGKGTDAFIVGRDKVM